MTTDLDSINARYEAMSAAHAYTMATIVKAAHLNQPRDYQLAVMRKHLGRSRHLDVIERAATTAIATGDAGLTGLDSLREPWTDLIRRQSLIGRMGGAVRLVPPIVEITTVDSGTSAGFVSENDPIPVQRPTLTDASLQPGRIALITPYTVELFRRSASRAAVLVQRDQTRALAIGEDTALLDGAAAITGGRPSSILSGLTALNSESPADLEADVLALLGTVRSGDPVAPFFITSPAGALALIGTRTSTGQRTFPGVRFNGGDIHGVPLLVSTGSPDILALVDADALHVADEGAAFDVATQASFQFDTAPSAGAATHVSLFQTSAIALRAERWIAWRLCWSDGAGYITLQTGSPS